MIYISLTTVPARLSCWPSFNRNLESLANQKTDKEYKIILSIPEVYRHDESQQYIIHDKLLEFNQKYPKLIINRETPDYGPIIKVYGALKYATDPDDIIIACDDDHVYHEEMLEYHVKKLNEHPHNAICFRGDIAVDKRIWTENGVTKYIYRPDDILFPVNRDCFMMIPGHWHSVGYWRRFFEDDFNEELFSLADGDDPIIGYYMKLHEHVPLCVVWDKETDLRPIIDSCGYKPTETFPIVEPLGYPESGGTVIRNKFKHSGYAFGGNHGREEEKISSFISNNGPEYIEKDINVFLPLINNPKYSTVASVNSPVIDIEPEFTIAPAPRFIELLRPYNIFMTKQRLGPDEDGGYVVPDYVLENCSALFTYGVGGDSRFEEAFASKYKMPVFLFDHTIREPEPWRLKDQGEDWRRNEQRWADAGCYYFPHGLGYGDLCKDFHYDYDKLRTTGYTLLKIDIEGGEYDYFLKTDIPLMGERVMGIILEVHDLPLEERRNEFMTIMDRFNEHFILCHIHGNNWGNLFEYENELIPQTMELTLINKKFVKKYELDYQDYPIEGLDLPNRPDTEDNKLTFAKPKKIYKTPYTPKPVEKPSGVRMSIGEIIDRYTICKLKSERGKTDNSKETCDLLNALRDYKDTQKYIDELYRLHGEIWDLEGDIRRGNENVLGLEEVGRRALKLRDMNKIRIDVKNEINSRYNEGYIEVKIDHGSETEPSVIISLTTVPERLVESDDRAIMSTIISLCEQDDSDYEVHFNIPEIYNITQTPYIIPDWLHEIKLKYPRLKVFRTEDMGPPTKMIPTLNRIKNPETMLLVVDDDLVYHPEMIKEHRKYHETLKGCVIVYEGRDPVTPTSHGDIRDSWVLCVTEIIEVKSFQHYKSASYMKKYFKEDFFIDYVGKTYSDDVLMSKYFRDHGIKMMVVPYEKDVHLFQTKEGWDTYGGVTSFPVLRHTSSSAHQTGCNHPGLLALPIGGRFYTPKKWDV